MSEADQHLLQLIRAGDHDGWNRFVARFQRRLIAFAVRQVDQLATAEDLVQECFVGFLKAFDDQREDSDPESLLFRILRRRIVDHYRRQGRDREIPACRFQRGDAAESPADPVQQAPSADMQASWYARREEERVADERALAAAIHRLAGKLQDGEKLRDLKIAEGLFYAGRRNRELAEILGTTENEIGVVKHRLVGRLKQYVREAGGSSASAGFDDAAAGRLLTTVWEDQRPSCPKRTTLGKFSLDLLPADWEEFVRFHVEVLGCTFCAANLEELTESDTTDEADSFHKRLFSSTVGFLRPQS